MRTRSTEVRPLRVVDSTLREGEQFAQAQFNPEDRIRLARALDAFGVDELELPSPALGPAAAEEVVAVVGLRLRAAVRVHVRCHPGDIEAALAAGATGLHLYLGTSPARAASRASSWPRLAREIRDSVTLARSSGAFVRFSAEDAFRTPIRRLFAAFDVAVEAGAQRLGVPDTVGVATPELVASTVRRVGRRYPGISQEFHGHNDTGCAVANSVAAWWAGAECLDVTVLGIGERVGITSLSGLMARLYTLAPASVSRYQLAQLPELDAQVAQLSGMAIPFNQPLTGEHAFTHVAGVHTHAVLRAPDTYEAIDPAVVGRSRVISVGSRLTGRHAVADFAGRLLGREVESGEVQAATLALRSAAATGRLGPLAAAGVVRAALATPGRE
ncbi:MAG: LeuA family protein [Candidatus Dormiibacterota bacterium]